MRAEHPKNTDGANVDRFSGRIDDYAKYRPSYPGALIQFLTHELALTPADHVADIGSGTGIFSILLLEHGNVVYGVEPSEEMRRKAEELLRSYPHFHSIAATAEATTLPDHSINMVTCAQAFHWCDPIAMRAECARIVKPGGYAVLIWNHYNYKETPFAAALEQCITTYAVDYDKVSHNKPEKHQPIDLFFGAGNYRTALFSNEQHVDKEGLKGRMFSSSYMPNKNHPRASAVSAALDDLFDRYAENNSVPLVYNCEIYYGRIGKP